ncbi:glycosyltransferase family 2 protein [Pedobacter sp.]|uniref:glycosyltransferase family 2 protein n=1 Tax=Pedobacter sp. TaxID=1411316 RepID=UPI00396C731E
MSGNSPKISIVIPVFNAITTIENVIKSVLDQTYGNKELIIINNLSTDGTTEVLESFGNQIDVLVSEKDKGIYDAMNKALKYCSGDWIYFLGSDDILYNNLVLDNIFSRENDINHSDIIYGNAFYIHRQTIRFRKMNRYKLAKHNFNHQTIFYPKEVFKHFSYDTKYKLWADYNLNIQLFFKTNYKFRYFDIIVAKFNDRGSSGNNDDKDFIRDKKRILHQIFPFDVLAFYYGRELFLLIRDFLKRKRNENRQNKA